MAQPGVVREPSMEEILASIRQIIESNEPGAGKAQEIQDAEETGPVEDVEEIEVRDPVSAPDAEGRPRRTTR